MDKLEQQAKKMLELQKNGRPLPRISQDEKINLVKFLLSYDNGDESSPGDVQLLIDTLESMIDSSSSGFYVLSNASM